MGSNATLGAYAEEHGTTDSLLKEPNSAVDEQTTNQNPGQDTQPTKPSPGSPLTADDVIDEIPLEGGISNQYIRNDRHVPLTWIPEYWKEKQASWNLLPRGAFSIIFDETSCQHGWPVDSDTQTGVYLRGQHMSNPPAPVEVDDELLAGAATTAAQAAHKVVSQHDLTDAPVVGLTKECASSLSIYLDSEVEPRQRVVYSNSHSTPLAPTIPETEESPPLFHGFTKIRLFNKQSGGRKHPGHEVYTKAEQPRLSLADIGWTQMLNDSL